MSAFQPVSRKAESLPDSGDRELLARIRAGDEAAFEELFRVHYEGMCSLAYMLMRSRDAARGHRRQRLPQSLEATLRLRFARPLRTYLLTATRNEAMSWPRQLRRQLGLEERASRENIVPALSSSEAAPDEVLAALEIRDAIEQAAAEPPSKCRIVFQLRWRDGLKHREIAEHMGLSVKTVEMHMTRARASPQPQVVHPQPSGRARPFRVRARARAPAIEEEGQTAAAARTSTAALDERGSFRKGARQRGDHGAGRFVGGPYGRGRARRSRRR